MMRKAWVASVAVVGGVFLIPPATAAAKPSCELLGQHSCPTHQARVQPTGLSCAHRSKVHVAEHGGIRADSRWHLAHGQRPTCDYGGGHPHKIRHSDKRHRARGHHRGWDHWPNFHIGKDTHRWWRND